VTDPASGAPADAVSAVSAVSVVCSDERSDGRAEPSLDLDRWARLAEGVLVAEGVAGELTLTFIDEAEMAELNEQHMGKTGSTDVLSFPLDEFDGADESAPGMPTLLGDIVISPAVAAGQFAEHAGTFEDEIALLVVHGVLHVLGHDHAEPDEAAVMRSLELEHLTTLHWHGPAPDGFRQTHDA
jgi:probable rRNA maturation factor